MTLKHFDFEAGPDGADVTTGNTGASLVSNPSSLGTIKFSTADKGAGALGVRMVAASTQDLTLRLPSAAAANVMALAVTFRATSIPASNSPVFAIRHASGVLLRFFIQSDGGMAIDGSPSTGNKALGVTAVAGTQYRAEILLNTGSTGTNGTVQVKVFQGNTTTQLGSTYSLTGLSILANPVAAVDLYAWRGETRGFDDARFNDGSTAWLGPALDPVVSPSALYRLMSGNWVPYQMQRL